MLLFRKSSDALKLNFDVMRRMVPTDSPSSSTSRSSGSRWLCMNMTPSMNCTLLAVQASSMARTSATVEPHGFSQRTCLPASAAFTTHSRRMPVGRGM